MVQSCLLFPQKFLGTGFVISSSFIQIEYNPIILPNQLNVDGFLEIGLAFRSSILPPMMDFHAGVIQAGLSFVIN
jgi:hypothetical protein